VFALVLLCCFVAFGVVGSMNIEVYFNLNLFIPPSNPVAKDLAISKKFFNDDGITITFYQHSFAD